MTLSHQGLCQAKFYQASYQHFQDFTDKINKLTMSLDNPGERNILSYFIATSLLYASRANCLAIIADINEHQACEEDKILSLGKLVQAQDVAVENIPEDIRVLEGMQTMLKNKKVKSLGAQIINELRVLQHNIQAVKP